jgi:AraC-like DNA-binding protein
MTHDELSQIQKLVGPITAEQMKYVDGYVNEQVGIFMPISGPCLYAVMPEHIHPSYMFIISFDDEMQMVLGGRTIHSSHGTLIALAPEIPHHEVYADVTPRYIAVLIEPSFFESQAQHYPGEIGPLLSDKYYSPSPLLLPHLRHFMMEAARKASGWEAILQALNIEICHAIIRSILSSPAEADQVTERVEINKAIAYIYAHLTEKISVVQIARAINMSTSHFSRLFKKEIGETPLSYLQRIRLERVKRLLGSGTRSVTEIALECGFGSSAYFATVFSKAFHMKPSDYQHLIQDGRILKK